MSGTKTPPKTLLLTTTTILSRPYEELGMVSSYPGAVYQSLAEKRLRKIAAKQYPQADAVIGIIVIRQVLGIIMLSGTAVRYKE
jgi:hypothetical protein